MGFKVRGVANVVKNLERAVARLQKAAVASLKAEAAAILDQAKSRTPVETGALRASGHVDKPKIDGRKISVQVAFGGPSAPYGHIVHEDLAAHHDNGQAKFLETALAEAEPAMAQRLGARLKKRIR
jgi:hypothetical protein